ncbi:acylphosphatase [Quadrisphaera granulorum]|uniref:acylphosphatase n=1 Tax=Quadrisphaera granulorum TaxID=317664 RepID=A0A316AFM7_9ACTN|nr:acylphosphatase [Quadrisphaera granulorum]PWJ56382.1 acylphosphatase [Quadrisphaera granulorum]SZE95016.1 acylphosphatase [Quadrisphaera granulorum]
MATLRATVTGHVQGVGFRWWVARRCEQLGLQGRGVNQADGSVQVTADGDPAALEELLADLRGGGAGRPGVVDAVDVSVEPGRG